MQNKIIGLLLLALVIALIVLSCERQQGHHVPEIAADTTALHQYRVRVQNFKARKDTIIITRTITKRIVEKAKASAVIYRDNPTLANCDTALTDCQKENKQKDYEIQIRDRALVDADSLWNTDRKELHRLRNLEPVKTKPKRFGIGAGIGYGITKTGLSPVVSVGIQYNFLQF